MFVCEVNIDDVLEDSIDNTELRPCCILPKKPPLEEIVDELCVTEGLCTTEEVNEL